MGLFLRKESNRSLDLKDTKNDGLGNVFPFKHGYFGLSMLDFRRGIYPPEN